MIAHKVAFHSNGQKLGQGMQPIMLPAGPGTASSNNGEGSGNMMSTILILGMAAIVTVFAVTVVMSDKRD